MKEQLDCVGCASHDASQLCTPLMIAGPHFVQEFYAITLDALKEGNNDRLWFKTNLKLCGLWFRSKEYGRAIRILKDLHRCASERCA